MSRAGKQLGASSENGKEMQNLNDRAIFKMNSLCLGFGLVLLYFFIFYFELTESCWMTWKTPVGQSALHPQEINRIHTGFYDLWLLTM